MRTPLLALVAVVLTVLGIAAAVAFFASKDDATVIRSGGPGVARPAGARPVVVDGNVLLLHRGADQAQELQALADEVGGPREAKLEAAGQAVLVRRQATLSVPIAALTATRRMDARRAGDPALVRFVEYWLGRRALRR